MHRTTLTRRPALTGTAAVAAALLALVGLLAVVAAPPAVAGPVPAASTAAATPLVTGGDVSWPQCPVGMGIPSRRSLGLPMPGDQARFVVIGLTNGPAFTPNPCLATQVQWARDRRVPVSAYAVATWPTARQLSRYAASGPYAGTTRRSRLRNVGYAEGTYNLRRLASVGLTVPHVWIDVEHYSIRPWSVDRRDNRAVVRGVARAYQGAGIATGFYSTSLQWTDIVGRVSWGLPEWHTAGPRSKAVALGRCSEASFQDGPVVLSQWWTDSADHDLVCPAGPAAASMPAFFAPAP
ncbi:MAG TPA: hypothetical protein VK640_12785 [Actinomycetes bacterium]|nr:hypothetical protein [Actinomycetes bacterium]